MIFFNKILSVNFRLRKEKLFLKKFFQFYGVKLKNKIEFLILKSGA